MSRPYRKIPAVAIALLVLSACAGRAPQPVDTVQNTDNTLTCEVITAEVARNNSNLQELGRQKGQKVAQNVAAGVAGLFIWPLWFAMDFQGAAKTEAEALQARNEYLANLYNRKDCSETT